MNYMSSSIIVHMRISKSDLEKARQVKAIIEKEYCNHYTYQQLAERVSTNPVKLQKAFKTVAGSDLYEYLILVRVEKAKELLESTEMTVETIACKLGWDKTNFNKQFKNITGTTPGAWRTNNEIIDNHHQQPG
jgi:YesN/AraC family two-component response regulator